MAASPYSWDGYAAGQIVYCGIRIWETTAVNYLIEHHPAKTMAVAIVLAISALLFLF
jgi:S-adenosylmethionine/arginine decarboxylase-like enzyme